MDAQCDRSWVIVAAIGGFAGTLRRLPLRPLPRIATALLIGACAAAAKAVVLRPRQEEALGAEAAAGSAANGQQEPAAAAQQQVQVAAALQQQRQHDSEQARLEAQLGINEALRTASPGERVKVGYAAPCSLCATLLLRTHRASTSSTVQNHPVTRQLCLSHTTSPICLLRS